MKIPRLLIPILTGALAFAGLRASGTIVTMLPASLAGSISSSSQRGFLVRTAQSWSTNGPVQNSYLRAFRQMNGTLLDVNNQVAANAAYAGTNTDGSYTVDTIDFEKDGYAIDVKDGSGTIVRSFSPGLFPGIPGPEGSTSNFTVEVVTYLQLQAGTNLFGVSSGAERTDVPDDDGFYVFTGANPRDFFATQIGAAEKNTSQPFASNQHLETQLVFVAPVAGIYPIRFLYWQTGHGANLEFYSIDPLYGGRILVNDPNDISSVPAYTDSTLAAPNAPYVAEVSPLPGSAGNAAATPVTALLIDGTATVNLSTVALTLNGNPATIAKSKIGGRTTVSYSPAPLRVDPNNAMSLTFRDSASVFKTNNWAFTISVAGGNSATVFGQWDFNYGDLRATIGYDLHYLDPTFDGPAGSAPSKTQFGTTAFFGIPDINGQVARVMHVPGGLDARYGYAMTHGISPNGGGTKVNQYTLIMDVYVAATGPGAASLWRVQPTGSSDGDLFWQGNNFGQGASGYLGKGTFTAGAWHRVIAAYDEAASTPVVTKFVDGIKQNDWTANQGLDNSRRAMSSVAYLFADGTPTDERREMWVKSVQIRAGKLTDAQMALLGGADAAGIPSSIPDSSVAGQWDFQRGDLSASIGADLAYLDPTVDGGTNNTSAPGDVTRFGSCSSLGVSLINGVDANIMQVPGDLNPGIGYAMTHRIAPNGGGTKVNQYTLIMDVMVNNTGPGAAALWRVQPTGSSDGDVFWQGNNFGQGGGGYNGKGTFTTLAWHRVVLAYDEAAATPVVTKFVDGIKQDDWTANQGLDNARRAMSPVAYLFADGTPTDERRKMWVKSVQIRAGKLSDAQIVALGTADGNAIPVATPATSVAGEWDFERGDLSATVGKPLQYLNPTVDGGTNNTSAPGNVTQFGTCSGLGVSLINGVDANIMQVPGDLNAGIGYVMDHGIAPNGGGTKVNQYTLIMDMMVNSSGPGAASLWKVNLTGNDGDLFWQGNNFGQGGGGYNGKGTFTPGAWHRVVAAYDEAASTPVVTKFVDGIKQDDWTANQGLDAARRAMGPLAYLFVDGIGTVDERRTMWVKRIQIRAGKMSDAAIIALGTPSAAAMPVSSVVPSAPALTMSPVIAGKTILQWPLSVSGYTLVSSSTLTGPWSAVSGVANNAVEVALGAGNKFFRLQQ